MFTEKSTIRPRVESPRSHYHRTIEEAQDKRLMSPTSPAKERNAYLVERNESLKKELHNTKSLLQSMVQDLLKTNSKLVESQKEIGSIRKGREEHNEIQELREYANALEASLVSISEGVKSMYMKSLQLAIHSDQNDRLSASKRETEEEEDLHDDSFEGWQSSRSKEKATKDSLWKALVISRQENSLLREKLDLSLRSNSSSTASSFLNSMSSIRPSSPYQRSPDNSFTERHDPNLVRRMEDTIFAQERRISDLERETGRNLQGDDRTLTDLQFQLEYSNIRNQTLSQQVATLKEEVFSNQALQRSQSERHKLLQEELERTKLESKSSYRPRRNSLSPPSPDKLPNVSESNVVNKVSSPSKEDSSKEETAE